MIELAQRIQECRVCENVDFELVIDFGQMCLTGVFQSNGASVPKAPLVLQRCTKCSLVQLGHNYPRSEKYVSIRGENLIPMSRRGNLVIGERIFTQDIWINELKQIVSSY